jgi:hypothetical protein
MERNMIHRRPPWILRMSGQVLEAEVPCSTDHIRTFRCSCPASGERAVRRGRGQHHGAAVGRDAQRLEQMDRGGVPRRCASPTIFRLIPCQVPCHHDRKSFTMPTIAIVGAGPGLGLFIAKVPLPRPPPSTRPRPSRVPATRRAEPPPGGTARPGTPLPASAGRTGSPAR